MAGFGQDEVERRRSIEVLDREVPVGGWQEIDLTRTLARIQGGGERGVAIGSALSAGGSASVLPFPSSSISLVGSVAPEIVRKVPQAAFVSIGCVPGSPVLRIPSRRAGSRFANDNVVGSPARSVWRDLFFLAILAATVFGAFWSGRVHGIQKVIVVPGPSSFHSVVT